MFVGVVQVCPFLFSFFLGVWTDDLGENRRCRADRSQDKSWELRILSAALQGLTALMLLLASERRKHKQRLDVAKQQTGVFQV